LVSAVNRVEGSLYLAEFHVDRESALSRFESRQNHPAIDLTEDRVADLVAAYPYSNTGLLIDLSIIDVEEAVENISHLTSATNPLDNGLWISSGGPDLID